MKFAMLLDHELKVADEEADLFGGSGSECRIHIRTTRGFTTPARRANLEAPEDPWVDQRAAADGDGIASGDFAHPQGVGDCSHIAIPDNGNALDSLHHGSDPFQINAATKPLSPRASVDRDCRDTELFE